MKYVCLLLACYFSSCFGKLGKVYTQSDDTLMPFKFVVNNADYSLAYAIEYILTESSIEIIYKGGVVGEKDSTLFLMKLEPSKNLRRLSEINIDSLKEDYTNPCVADGSQLMVVLNKGGKQKSVQLSNYYQSDIGRVIEYVNSIVPERYSIWYDKAQLVKYLDECK